MQALIQENNQNRQLPNPNNRQLQTQATPAQQREMNEDFGKSTAKPSNVFL